MEAVLSAKGKPQTQVRYSIAVYQDFYDEVPGLKSIEGSFRDLGFGQAFSFLRKDLVLTLQDGRKLRCLLQNSDGSFVGNGPIV